jgi:hypothetical protein
MKPLFNFEDETLNKGFQIDMSVLSTEQREHTLQIFQARGIDWYAGQKATKFDMLIGFNWLCFNANGRMLLSHNDSAATTKLPLIDYPTLCRAAVQLEPKEPVYDFKWLDVVLQKYNPLYRYYNDKDLVDIDIEINGRRDYISLDPKASAGIILEALAKELNVNNDSLIDYEIIAYQDGKYSVTRCHPQTAYFGEVKFAWNTAQKAIDILSTHFPEVLKNYFA